MNRIKTLFQEKKNNILSIYFSAGFPKLNDTMSIIEELEKSGTDLIEIGIPFSDPLADGPVIQHSNEIALKNGMSLKLLFEQLKEMRTKTKVPIILMGYLNPVLQFGVENFCKRANEVGVDGIILPDLPMQEYQEFYKATFEKYNLINVFLVTPQTSVERIKLIDENSKGFIYLVSSASTTGVKTNVDVGQVNYFERLQKMKLKNPTLIGFGISDKKSFLKACNFANGAIVGSAFIKAIENSNDLKNSIQKFIHEIR